jgi:hypothetical protein
MDNFDIVNMHKDNGNKENEYVYIYVFISIYKCMYIYLNICIHSHFFTDLYGYKYIHKYI